MPSNWEKMKGGDKAQHISLSLSKVNLSHPFTGDINTSKKKIRHVIWSDGFYPKSLLMSRAEQFSDLLKRSKTRQIANDPDKPHVEKTWQMIGRVKVNSESFWMDTIVHKYKSEDKSTLYHVRLSKTKPRMKK